MFSPCRLCFGCWRVDDRPGGKLMSFIAVRHRMLQQCCEESQARLRRKKHGPKTLAQAETFFGARSMTVDITLALQDSSQRFPSNTNVGLSVGYFFANSTHIVFSLLVLFIFWKIMFSKSLIVLDYVLKKRCKWVSTLFISIVLLSKPQETVIGSFSTS